MTGGARQFTGRGMGQEELCRRGSSRKGPGVEFIIGPRAVMALSGGALIG